MESKATRWDLNESVDAEGCSAIEAMAAEVMGEGEEHRSWRATEHPPARVPRQIKIIVSQRPFLGSDSDPELVNSDKLIGGLGPISSMPRIGWYADDNLRPSYRSGLIFG